MQIMIDNDTFQKLQRLDSFSDELWEGREYIHEAFFFQLVVVSRQWAKNRKNSRLERDDRAEMPKLVAFSRSLIFPWLSGVFS